MTGRTRVALLAAFVLVVAAINTPVALWCVQGTSRLPGTTISNVIGPEAAAHSWPARTPHALPWPAIRQHQVDRLKFGTVRITAWAGNGTETSHQMSTTLYGWPLGSLSHTRRWWPWDDPAWALSNDHADTGLRLHWAGTLLNPLLVGGSLWLVALGLPWLWLVGRSRRRLRRGLCPACAYPFSSPDRCTECGLARRSAAGADHGVAGPPRSANPAASA